MKFKTQSPLHVLLFSLILIFQFSCSKDSDLLTDYVLADTKADLVIGKFVVDDTFITTIDNSIVLDVLANDAFENTEEVVVTETTAPANGTVEINTDNTVTYTPETTEATVDTFTYTTEVIVDETVSTETGTVTIAVEDPNKTTPITDFGELKAFPNAYGGGAFASGGRGGKVIHVTTLASSGTGSFREALTSSGARTIVFDVSGNIDLGGSDINVYNGNLTIAGQTAPQGGITTTKGTIYFVGAHNVIVRYIRARAAQGEGDHNDAYIFWGCNDVILDHISTSFGGDQALTLNPNQNSQRRQTVQRSIFSDSETGIIIGDSNSPYNETADLSFLCNVVVDMPHRTPNIGGDGQVEIINNVIYNWRNRLTTISGGAPHLNHIANYYKRGRSTEQNIVAYNANKLSEGSTLIYTKKNYYNSSVSGSVLTGNESTTNSIIWSTRSSSNPVASNYFTETQFPLLGAAAPILSATDAYNSLIILKDVGANKYIDDNGDVKTYIDPYDKTKLDNIANDISTTAYRDYSSWVIPTLPENTRGETYDSDGDGMADNWELANSLDPNNANDANADRNGDGYTNLEDFLNQVDF